MVFKVSKGGVRTGNTLRGLHSSRTKRYGRHACLLGCTSLGRRDLTRLIKEDSRDHQWVKDTLGKTDVLLSLNKQQRWRLPAIVGKMIKEGEFNTGATVSMLEKHKLKRRANCVGLVSTNTRNAIIAPKQKKYFSFTLDSVAEEESRRKRKKALAEELKNSMKLEAKDKIKKNSNKGHYKTIEAYTSEGKKTPLLRKGCQNDKPEYRLEVLYPCPQSCSLTYNPKYTDVMVTEGKSGELEVKSNVKAEKKGLSTHRKKLMSRDTDWYQKEAIENDVSKMWEECNEIEHKEEEHPDKQCENHSMKNILEMLTVEAEKAKELCMRRKDCIPKRKRHSKSFFSEDEDKKSHIIYIDKEMDDIDIEKSAIEKQDKAINQIEEMHEIMQEKHLDFFRVVLSASEVAPERLRNDYGCRYAEASSLPRRFILDVSADVASLMGKSKTLSSRNSDFLSYLVCVYDGIYDDGLDVYKIAFNSVVGIKYENVSHFLQFVPLSFEDIMNAVASHLLDPMEKDQLQIKSTNSERLIDTFLQNQIGTKVEVFDPAKEMSRISITDEIDNSKMEALHSHFEDVLTSNIDIDVFCDVCYVSVTPSRIDSMSGTKLKSCGHILCDECWACHFRTKIRDGQTKMACGGYDCDTNVGHVTLLSILPVSEVALLLQRHAEEKFDSMENAKWCPFPGCGRVIKVDTKFKDLCVDVICACGNKLCFSCFGPAHWPATCEQAEEYLDKLPNLKPAKEYVEEEEKRTNNNNTSRSSKKVKKPEIMMVEGRLCPRCTRFIEKNGGCPHMVCRCGYGMCWTCMKSFHYSGQCIPDPMWVYKHTRMLVVRHAVQRKLIGPDDQKSESVDNDKPPKIVKNKQRTSLYQRALQHREEGESLSNGKSSKALITPLLTKMVKEAGKDLQFKMEILQAYSVPMMPGNQENMKATDVTGHVKSLLEASVKMRQELHHVTEFTFILLQGTQNNVARQQLLKLVNDLSGYCSFVRSILELQERQDAKVAFRRLVDLQEWARRGLDALVRTSRSLRLAE